jgi:hypothetical protein
MTQKRQQHSPQKAQSSRFAFRLSLLALLRRFLPFVYSSSVSSVTSVVKAVPLLFRVIRG